MIHIKFSEIRKGISTSLVALKAPTASAALSLARQRPQQWKALMMKFMTIDDDVSVHSLNMSGMSLSSTASDSPDSPPNSARSFRMLQKKGEKAFKQIDIRKFFQDLDSDE